MINNDTEMYVSVDVETLDWADYYHYFMNTGAKINITSAIDVTNARKFTKDNHFSFYAFCIYAIAVTLNALPNFKYDMINEQLIKWHHMVPTFTDLNPETGRFHSLWTDSFKSFNSFHRAFQDLTKAFKNSNEIAPLGTPPLNSFAISVLPDCEFTSFSVSGFDKPKQLKPMITIGKYHEDNNRIMMPIALEVHHATVDGKHIGDFYTLLQKNFNQFDEQIDETSL